MRVNSNKRLLSVAVLAAATALPVTPVFAQSGVLEEVVVTSRKRTENLQDVGFAVSALTKSEIEGQFARDITDLANISPNIVIDDTAQGPGGVEACLGGGGGALEDLDRQRHALMVAAAAAGGDNVGEGPRGCCLGAGGPA